jgi:hypothetical protein
MIAVLAAPVLLGPAAAVAQAPAPAPSPVPAPTPVVTTPGIPGNPTVPSDVANNPHPTMPWTVTSAYGVVQRWLWVPPRPVSLHDTVVYEPGYWVAQTNAGYYYPTRWVLREVAPGTVGWVLVNGGAVPYAR